jgi:hypothetical protein
MREKNLAPFRKRAVGATHGRWMSTPNGRAIKDSYSELFRGKFDLLMGPVLPPVIFSQVPTGT